jgi:hypothetical protein
MHKDARIQSPLRGSEIIGDCLPKARRLALGLVLTAAPQLVQVRALKSRGVLKYIIAVKTVSC